MLFTPMSDLGSSGHPLPSSSATSNVPEQPPCESIDGVPLDWSGRGTSHVDYDKSEILPLSQGGFLGHGMNGGVYETSCDGIKLAWKRKYCRRKIGERERREIEIIKKLSHRHIIRLIGTYTHGPFLGLLLWPVATCDLDSFIEDVDWLMKRVWAEGDEDSIRAGDEVSPKHDPDREARLRVLGVFTLDPATSIYPAKTLLKQTIDCIVSAVTYLHSSDIKHKDLKPSNILLSSEGLWLTDFGTATDYSVLTTSVSENGERGTPKYFAPEVAGFAPSGRSADIFSLGYILFEIITVAVGETLQLSQRLRQSSDKSFQSNLGHIIAWFEGKGWVGYTAADSCLMGLTRWMMDEESITRPTADEVETEITLIHGLGIAFKALCGRSQDAGLVRVCCCSQTKVGRKTTIPPTLSSSLEIKVVYGSTSYPTPRSRSDSTLYLRHNGGELVERVHIFTDRTRSQSHLIIDAPPYEIKKRIRV